MDRREPGVVVWYTGLSGAGKSTIARAVHERLCGAGVASELLDGDAIRALMPTGFTRADREGHVKRVAFMASRLERHGVTVHCALISPYAEVRRWAREQCRRFVEVYVSTPLAECERRDPKGLYAAARRGAITQFTGIDDPYEPPEHPEVTIDTTGTPLEDAVARVVAAWERAR